MNSIDVNYILDGQVELFDYIFFGKVGIDGDKNYVYQIQDKFRDYRYAKFIVVNDPLKIREIMTPLLIYQNSNQSKLIQPIYDFTVSKDKRMILVTMPVPPRTLYSVIKDTKVNLRVRLFLVQNLANGGVYMHNRRRFVFGHIRPESIAIHEQLNVFQRGKSSKKYSSSISQPIELYARLNSFSTIIQTQTKAEKWKWMNTQLQYYDAPQIWSEMDRKRGAQVKMHSNQSEKSVEPSKQIKYTQKSDVWALGLIMVEILTATRIHQLLGSKDIVPGRLLKQLTIKQKLLKSQAKANQPLNSNQNEKGSNYYKKTQQFYDQLLKYIECFPIRSILQRMLSYKPDKRPTIQQVLLVVQRLEVIDKRNKNLGRITSYRRSLKNLRQTLQQKQKNHNKLQEQENFDDKKSVMSMKSVRSGKSSKSHVSQSRKRIPPDFTAILYARQQISQIHTMPTNPMYRTYYQDCKNRLPIDVNFTPPPKKFIMKKDDKAIILSLKGEKDQDIKKWNIQKAIGNSLQQYEDRILEGINARQNNITTYSQNKNLLVETDKNKPTRKYDLWLYNLRQEQEKKNQLKNDKNVNFGPVLKKIPHSTATMKQYGYNDNLTNYHVLGVQYNKQASSLQTCLFRKQIPTSTQLPQKFPQFILNLRNRNLLTIPSSLSECLQPPNCLKYLCLARNQIISMKPLLINKNLCQNLMIIDLTNNHIKQIDINIWEMKYLEQCYLGWNQIVQMKGFDDDNKQDEDNKQNTCQNYNKVQYVQQHKNISKVEDEAENQILPQNEQNQENELNMNNMVAQIQQNQQKQQNIISKALQIQNQQSKQSQLEINTLNRKACLKLKKLYLNSNKIKFIQNVFDLPSLQVLVLGKNPLAENISNMEAFTTLRNKNVKIYY